MAACVERILDWFHLGMKIQNISLPESIKPKLIRKMAFNSERALQRSVALIKCSTGVLAERLEKLKTYIENNL